ncbi:MAG: protein-L-isoaspartate(D-aspartate) O-methyltransferase [Thioalkalispiraceae bacterium]|jgi:protein-L-isoaspartate(D-aspartate) O-methyltransferase
MNKKIKNMLNTIKMEAEYTSSSTGRYEISEPVMQVMEEVDRADFIPETYKGQAYDNGPLPIGYGQTISQPFMVACMTDLLELEPEHTVLEIGTGSGYQAAILSRLAKKIYSIERIPELAEAASERLKQLGYKNIEVRCVDGYGGWQENAPFDAIIVTAAATHIPQALVDQLKPGGRMVIPVGLQYMPQELMLVSKDEQGQTETRGLFGVAFVPLISDREVESQQDTQE